MPQEKEQMSEEQQIITFRNRLLLDASFRAAFTTNPDAVLESETSLSPRVRVILLKLHTERDRPPPSSPWMV